MDAATRIPATAIVTRYGGLAGSALLAVAGAWSEQRHISWVWLAGLVLLVGSWLLLGRRLAGVRLSWLLVTAALWALPVLVSGPLESRDVYSYACQGSLVVHGIDPYAHGPASLPCPWLSHVTPLWRSAHSPYGPLWLMVSGAGAATGRLALAVAVLRVAALAGMALVGWAGHRLARTVGVDPVRAAWLGIASPLVMIHALSGAHNDALLAGLVAAAFAVATRVPATPAPTADAAARGWGRTGTATPVVGRRWGRTGTATPVVGRRWGRTGQAALVGALLGLAFAVKANALVALPFVVLLIAADRRWRSILGAAATAGAGLIGAFGLLWALTGFGLGWVSALSNTTRSIIEPNSIPTGLGLGAAKVLGKLGQPDLARHAVGYFRAAGLVVLAGLLVAVWLWARRECRAASVVPAAGVALLASVVLAPVAFPWYALAGVALLAYGLTDDRLRYGLALLVAPVGLLILPNGRGLAIRYLTASALFEATLVVAVASAAVIYLVRQRRAERTPTGAA